MSIHIIGEVWDHSRSRGTARLVLLALADNADRQTRIAWPGVEDLAKRTRVSERSVQRALRALEGLREIELIEAGRPGQRARYRVIPEGRQTDALTPPKSDTGGEEGRHRGLRMVSPVSPVPSEPSREPVSARDKRPMQGRYDRVIKR